MDHIFPICAFKDNYIWCFSHNAHCAIIDPGDAKPVIAALQERELTLSAILVTHHHYDHTQGIQGLLCYQPVPVYGPQEIPQVTIAVHTECSFVLAEKTFEFVVFAVPGHTLDHIAYYYPGLAFTGDTLFTAGCGKIFEGTAKKMYASLAKLNSLPEETLIYCGHEYTENNLRFARLVEPSNIEIKERLQETIKLREKNLPTVPATLKLEKSTNPFLRCDQPDVIVAASQYCQRALDNPIEVLAVLREWKNSTGSYYLGTSIK
jgi:hydroxyacylglutathione hydrolase